MYVPRGCPLLGNTRKRTSACALLWSSNLLFCPFPQFCSVSLKQPLSDAATPLSRQAPVPPMLPTEGLGARALSPCHFLQVVLLDSFSVTLFFAFNRELKAHPDQRVIPVLTDPREER